jgi:hypothetical protein
MGLQSDNANMTSLHRAAHLLRRGFDNGDAQEEAHQNRCDYSGGVGIIAKEVGS